MKFIYGIFVISYAACSLAVLLSLYFFHSLFFIFKPLTLLLLMTLYAVYFFKTKKMDRFKIFILSGILSGFTAQFFFMSNNSNVGYFFGGLSFFLIGHIFYIVGFSRYAFSVRPAVIAAAALVGISYDTFLFFHIFPVFGLIVFIPVVCYTVFLLAMFLSAFNHDVSSRGGFHAVAAGGLVFVISDMIFSFFIFVSRFPFGDLAVLSTYFAAQGLIGFGMMNYFIKEKNRSGPA